MQMIHAIWTYLRVVEQVNGTIGVTVVDFILPTGAMGNMTGSYMAKKMGVPIGMMCAGVNINDITHRVVQTGKFHREETMKMTLSEALNIQVPYNFERILFYLTQSNDKLVKEWMSTMDLEIKLILINRGFINFKQSFSLRGSPMKTCVLKSKERRKITITTSIHTRQWHLQLQES